MTFQGEATPWDSQDGFSDPTSWSGSVGWRSSSPSSYSGSGFSESGSSGDEDWQSGNSGPSRAEPGATAGWWPSSAPDSSSDSNSWSEATGGEFWEDAASDAGSDPWSESTLSDSDSHRPTPPGSQVEERAPPPTDRMDASRARQAPRGQTMSTFQQQPAGTAPAVYDKQEPMHCGDSVWSTRAGAAPRRPVPTPLPVVPYAQVPAVAAPALPPAPAAPREATAFPDGSPEAWDMKAAATAVDKMSSPSGAKVLEVTDLLGLMRAHGWGGVLTPALRPQQIMDPIGQALMLFREPHDYMRRQKVASSKAVSTKIDRWKNSGGKHAVVTLDIPFEMQRGQGFNVIVARHGRVLRVEDRSNLRYRQWTYGMMYDDGRLVEMKSPGTHTLYQVFDEKLFKFGGFAPLPRKGKVVVSKPSAKRTAAKVEPSFVDQKDSSAGVAELDFRMLGESLGRQVFTGSAQKKARTEPPMSLGQVQLDYAAVNTPFINTNAGGSRKKPRKAAMSALASAMLIAVVYTVASSGGGGSDVSTDVASCDTIPFVQQDSVLACAVSGTGECDFQCEPGYSPHGVLRCGGGGGKRGGASEREQLGTCLACVSGTFSDHGKQCVACTECGTQVQTDACTPTTDTVCFG